MVKRGARFSNSVSSMDTGFFKWVWRFNALALAGVIALALVMLVRDATRTFFRDTRAPATVNIDPVDETLEETLEIGDPSFNRQTGLIEFAVLRPQTYDSGGYISSGSGKRTYNNVVNRGFLDPETKETRWLLENTNGLIVWERDIVREKAPDNQEGKQVATLFRLVTEDTTNDQRLSASDTGHLYWIKPDGTGLLRILDDASSALQVSAFDASTEIFRVTNDGDDQLLFVDVAKGQIVERLVMPTLDDLSR